MRDRFEGIGDMNMTLEELEQELNVTFPKLFHIAYDNGDMEWLTLTYEEFQRDSQKYIDSPHSFMIFPSWCELTAFDRIFRRKQDLDELLTEWQEYECLKMRENIGIIPFGQSPGGDFYCFLYRDNSAEPCVIQIYHDEYYARYEAVDFEELLFGQMVEALAQGDLNKQGEQYKHHCRYLSDEHKAILEGKDKKQLLELFENRVYPDCPINEW